MEKEDEDQNGGESGNRLLARHGFCIYVGMGKEDYMTCEGLGCPFKDDCKRYEANIKAKEEKRYVFTIFPSLTDKGCTDKIKK